MTDAQTILTLIETVDFEYDQEILREIDCRVDAYVRNLIYLKRREDRDGEDFSAYHVPRPDTVDGVIRMSAPRYTKSRDALKAIRPASISFIELKTASDGDAVFKVGLGWNDIYGRADKIIDTAKLNKFLPTEELAELHAIIQAIAYERNQ